VVRVVVSTWLVGQADRNSFAQAASRTSGSRGNCSSRSSCCFPPPRQRRRMQTKCNCASPSKPNQSIWLNCWPPAALNRFFRKIGLRHACRGLGLFVASRPNPGQAVGPSSCFCSTDCSFLVFAPGCPLLPGRVINSNPKQPVRSRIQSIDRPIDRPCNTTKARSPPLAKCTRRLGVNADRKTRP
jgi:hypothetical protein